jgi:hypothetical protein
MNFEVFTLFYRREKRKDYLKNIVYSKEIKRSIFLSEKCLNTNVIR